MSMSSRKIGTCSRICCENAAGELPAGTTPIASNFFVTSGDARMRAIVVLTRLTTSGGIPAGPSKAWNESNRNFGNTVSAKVDTSGRCEERVTPDCSTATSATRRTCAMLDEI